ncbi:PREDICTED: yemanuclein-alpha [Ceratosolen solmsi marchali]|uniref:Yemanuclein-alpha n=1 Tax=Ceratosolen solmsi marchali TaxID=326594 RepID=A0AAJ7E0H8_9HYME|nr:PREDICTED: yemanuclein-alpha [Ceratosolen solmsi marchali]
MAEIKRVPLQSVDHGSQTSKKSEKIKQIAPSFRFVLNLPESNEEKCPEFNYAQLLKSAEKKRRKDKKKDENSVTNGLTPFEDTEDDEKILDVARYFESKYGNRKKSDYVDLGAGYDESDSFIDNTDAYDEIVPEEVTTVHGGFYVNSGPLEFKDSDNASIVNRNNINNDNENGNDDDEESSDEDSDDQTMKRINKRSLSSSDNEEIEDLNPPKSKARLDDAEYTIVD